MIAARSSIASSAVVNAGAARKEIEALAENILEKIRQATAELSQLPRGFQARSQPRLSRFHASLITATNKISSNDDIDREVRSEIKLTAEVFTDLWANKVGKEPEKEKESGGEKDNQADPESSLSTTQAQQTNSRGLRLDVNAAKHEQEREVAQTVQAHAAAQSVIEGSDKGGEQPGSQDMSVSTSSASSSNLPLTPEEERRYSLSKFSPNKDRTISIKGRSKSTSNSPLSSPSRDTSSSHTVRGAAVKTSPNSLQTPSPSPSRAPADRSIGTMGTGHSIKSFQSRGGLPVVDPKTRLQKVLPMPPTKIVKNGTTSATSSRPPAHIAYEARVRRVIQAQTTATSPGSSNASVSLFNGLDDDEDDEALAKLPTSPVLVPSNKVRKEDSPSQEKILSPVPFVSLSPSVAQGSPPAFSFAAYFNAREEQAKDQEGLKEKDKHPAKPPSQGLPLLIPHHEDSKPSTTMSQLENISQSKTDVSTIPCASSWDPSAFFAASSSPKAHPDRHEDEPDRHPLLVDVTIAEGDVDTRSKTASAPPPPATHSSPLLRAVAAEPCNKDEHAGDLKSTARLLPSSQDSGLANDHPTATIVDLMDDSVAEAEAAINTVLALLDKAIPVHLSPAPTTSHEAETDVFGPTKAVHEVTESLVAPVLFETSPPPRVEDKTEATAAASVEIEEIKKEEPEFLDFYSHLNQLPNKPVTTRKPVPAGYEVDRTPSPVRPTHWQGSPPDSDASPVGPTKSPLSPRRPRSPPQPAAIPSSAMPRLATTTLALSGQDAAVAATPASQPEISPASSNSSPQAPPPRSWQAFKNVTDSPTQDSATLTSVGPARVPSISEKAFRPVNGASSFSVNDSIATSSPPRPKPDSLAGPPQEDITASTSPTDSRPLTTTQAETASSPSQQAASPASAPRKYPLIPSRSPSPTSSASSRSSSRSSSRADSPALVKNLKWVNVAPPVRVGGSLNKAGSSASSVGPASMRLTWRSGPAPVRRVWKQFHSNSQMGPQEDAALSDFTRRRTPSPDVPTYVAMNTAQPQPYIYSPSQMKAPVRSSSPPRAADVSNPAGSSTSPSASRSPGLALNNGHAGSSSGSCSRSMASGSPVSTARRSISPRSPRRSLRAPSPLRTLHSPVPHRPMVHQDQGKDLNPDDFLSLDDYLLQKEKNEIARQQALNRQNWKSEERKPDNSGWVIRDEERLATTKQVGEEARHRYRSSPSPSSTGGSVYDSAEQSIGSEDDRDARDTRDNAQSQFDDLALFDEILNEALAMHDHRA